MIEMWSILEKILRKRVRLYSKQAIVSFTFDDAPVSSFIKGGKILEVNGFRGTYYVSAGLIEQSTEVGKIADLRTIKKFHGRGHEIANHTYGHINCRNSNLIHMVKDVRKNSKRLDGLVNNNFSYPYGAIDSEAYCAACLCTTSARGISFGINRDIIDPINLKAVKIYSRLGIDAGLDLISECATQGGWLIFYTHDVCDNPSDYGCTPEQLTKLVEMASINKLSILTMEKAMESILGRQV